MANKENLLQFVAQQVPPQQLQQMVDQVEQELSQDPDATPAAVAELLKQLEYVAENPQAYKEVVTAAIQAGMIDPQDVPPQFDPMFVGVLLLAVRELIARTSQRQPQAQMPMGGMQQGFAKGGLAQAAKQLQAQGRGGDTILAHINPREAEVLRRMGGAGTINPNTGLREFKKGGIGKIFKSIAKAALPIFAGSFFGPLGGAVVGAGMGAMQGGGLKGAVLGGLGGYLNAPGNALGGATGLANTVGKGATSALSGLGGIGEKLASTFGTEQLGAGLIGMGTSALRGDNPFIGGLTAGITSGLAPKLGELTSGTGLSTYGNAFADAARTGAIMGENPITAGTGGALAALGSNLMSGSGLFPTAPTNAGGTMPTDGPDYSGAPGLPPMTLPATGTSTTVGTGLYDDAGNLIGNQGGVLSQISNKIGSAVDTVTGGSSGSSDLFSGKNLLLGLGALSALSGATPVQAQEIIANSNLSAEQKAAMSRNLENYTAQWNAATLPAQGTPEYEDMMKKISQGVSVNFLNPTITGVGGQQITPNTPAAPAAPQSEIKLKRGGALSKVSMMASGKGDGRSDTINARLSDGEYVIDAETVALLGNGSTKAGAAVLDKMRKELRQQKGKALAKGKFSPDAKSPLAYMKGGLK